MNEPLPYFGIKTYHNRAEAIAHANAAAKRYCGVWRCFDLGNGTYRVLAIWGNPAKSWRCIHRAENWIDADAQAAPF